MGSQEQEETNKQMQLETQAGEEAARLRNLLSYLSPWSPENLKRVNQMIDFFEQEYAKNQLENIQLQQLIIIQKINIIKVEEKEQQEKIQEQKNTKTQDVQVLKREGNEEKEKQKEQEEKSEEAEFKQDTNIKEEGKENEVAAAPTTNDDEPVNETPSNSRRASMSMKPP